MINNNKFYSLIAFTKPKLNPITNLYSSIVSSHYLFNPDTLNIPRDIYIKRLDNFYNNKLVLISIDKEYEEIKSYKIGNSLNKDFTEFIVPYSQFFSEQGINEFLLNNEQINNSIYMFRDLDYRELVNNLALFKIIISGGSNNKKHILSPIQLRKRYKFFF